MLTVYCCLEPVLKLVQAQVLDWVVHGWCWLGLMPWVPWMLAEMATQAVP